MGKFLRLVSGFLLIATFLLCPEPTLGANPDALCKSNVEGNKDGVSDGQFGCIMVKTTSGDLVYYSARDYDTAFDEEMSLKLVEFCGNGRAHLTIPRCSSTNELPIICCCDKSFCNDPCQKSYAKVLRNTMNVTCKDVKTTTTTVGPTIIPGTQKNRKNFGVIKVL